MRRKSASGGEMRRKSVNSEKCVEKVFFWRNASKKCKHGEMRRKSATPPKETSESAQQNVLKRCH